MTLSDSTRQVLEDLGSPYPEKLQRADSLRVGLITDTHGLLRPQALQALRGVDAVLHTGDIGGPEILSELAEIAPVRAVRGNNDAAEWADAVPETACFELAGCSIYAIHDRNDLRSELSHLNANVLISGHSHRPSIAMEDGVLCVNSGSAGPRRFSLPVGIALLEIRDGAASAELVTLQL